MGKLEQGLATFLFPAKSDSWLTILRVGLGFHLILYCLSAHSDWALLYSSNGNSLISRDLAEAILSVESALVPRIGWLVRAGELFGLSESLSLKLIWDILLGAAICLLLGIFTRPAAILAWLLHLCAVKSATLTSYGMDNFTSIGLFYLMVAPLPDRWSLEAIRSNLPQKNSSRHGFHLRVLQLHLCLIYFLGGVTKLLGPDWWNGESIWRALTRSPFNLVSPQLLANWSGLLPLLGISVCLLETTYPLLIWPKATRHFCLAAVLLMHLGIALTMGLYLFALIMIVLNLAAFAPDLIARRTIGKP